MKQTKLQRTIELANLALLVAKESLWINNLVGNKWEIVVLDQNGYATNHKYRKCLNTQDLLVWINEWTTNYEIMKSWKNKKQNTEFQCYT